MMVQPGIYGNIHGLSYAVRPSDDIPRWDLGTVLVKIDLESGKLTLYRCQRSCITDALPTCRSSKQTIASIRRKDIQQPQPPTQRPEIQTQNLFGLGILCVPISFNGYHHRALRQSPLPCKVIAPLFFVVPFPPPAMVLAGAPVLAGHVKSNNGVVDKSFVIANLALLSGFESRRLYQYVGTFPNEVQPT
jgi:hypothetical protein